ncbi:MAG: hypothetical protein HY294_07045 [Candidatus Rokubacteria bacterium]|nr:hypothetical protein [Candidatus Rokubacteria bacterium]MBI3825732.1 hypothetical protein [Candidatus Rokubacteria bacterium]
MSLVELLVSLALVGGVLTATMLALDQMERAHATGVARMESQQTARIALERLAHDVRRAGFANGPSAGFAAVSIADPGQIQLQLDLNSDGVIAGPGETITWHLDGSGILRRNAGGGAQPIVNGVRAFSLDYFDGTDAPAGDPAAVRSVVASLTTAAWSGTSELAAGVSTTVQTRVRLRNR